MKQLDFFETIIEEAQPGENNPPVYQEEKESLNLISDKAICKKEEYCCYECKRLEPVSWNEIEGISGTCIYKTGIFLGTDQACCMFDPVRRKYEASSMEGDRP